MCMDIFCRIYNMKQFLKSIFYNSEEKINLVKCTNCENQLETDDVFKEDCKFCGQKLFTIPYHSPGYANYEILNYRNVDVLKPVFKFLLSPFQVIFAVISFPFVFLLVSIYSIVSGILSKLLSINKASFSMDVFLIFISYVVFTNLYSRKIILSEIEIWIILISIFPFLIFSSLLIDDFNYDWEEQFKYKAKVYLSWFFLALLVTYV
jgi:hypothetical protein